MDEAQRRSTVKPKIDERFPEFIEKANAASDYIELHTRHINALARIEELEAQNAELKKCAEFYADANENWYRSDEVFFNRIADKDVTTEGEGIYCGGKLARETLAEIAVLELNKGSK